MKIRMQSLMLWSFRHPKHVIVLLLGATLFFACYIPAVPVEMSPKMLWIKDDPAIAQYDDALETFGSGKITVVLVKDHRLFTPEMLERLSGFQRTLERIPDVDRVDSLFSMANPKGKAGVFHTGPFVKKVPDTHEKALAIKADALGNPVAVKNLISHDGSAMAFNVLLDEAASPEEQRRFSIRVDEAIKTISPHVETVFQFGHPYLTRMMHESQMSDQRWITPLAFLLFTLLSFVIWRSFSIMGLITVTSGLSIVWTMGFMGLFGLPMNPFTAIVPALLIAVGSTEDTHLFSEYLTGLRETGARSEAIAHMIEKISTPLFLTGLTTFLGFLAITINKILILKQFGLVCAFGLFANPLITFLVAPIWLKWLGPRQAVHGGAAARGRIDSLFSGLARAINHLIRANGRLTFGVITGGILLMGLFSFDITFNNDVMGMFKPSSAPRRHADQLHKELAGVRSFVIHIKGKTANAFHRPENLARIAGIQASLRQNGWCDLTTSIVDYLVLMHSEMNDGDAGHERIPESSDLIAQYLLILSGDNAAAFITNDAGEAAIAVRYHAESSDGFKEIIAWTTGMAGKHLSPDFDFHITGESILTMRGSHTLVIGQVLSLSFTLIVVCLLMSLLFSSIKAGVLSLIPNLLPIILLFGIMGLSGISLNPGTSMVAVIAIGIAVDDTIHFMARYYSEMRRLKNRDQAIETSIHHEIRPITATSLGLALGFGTLMLSNLLPLVHFGFLAASVMMFALMADLLITPIILSFTELLTSGLIGRKM